MSEIEIRRRSGDRALASNGNSELPEHRQKQVEAGLATYQAVLAQRDELDGKLSEACKTIAGLTVQLDALKSVVNMMESTYKSTELDMKARILEHQQVRDEAVAKAATLQATIDNVFSILAGKVYEEPTNEIS